MNWAALGEFVLAVLTPRWTFLRRVLGTSDLTMQQFRWALLPVVALLLLWEAGKLIARGRQSHVGA